MSLSQTPAQPPIGNLHGPSSEDSSAPFFRRPPLGATRAVFSRHPCGAIRAAPRRTPHAAVSHRDYFHPGHGDQRRAPQHVDFGGIAPRGFQQGPFMQLAAQQMHRTATPPYAHAPPFAFAPPLDVNHVAVVANGQVLHSYTQLAPTVLATIPAQFRHGVPVDILPAWPMPITSFFSSRTSTRK
jgi:hypothetical protein